MKRPTRPNPQKTHTHTISKQYILFKQARTYCTQRFYLNYKKVYITIVIRFLPFLLTAHCVIDIHCPLFLTSDIGGMKEDIYCVYICSTVDKFTRGNWLAAVHSNSRGFGHSLLEQKQKIKKYLWIFFLKHGKRLKVFARQD